MRLEASGTCDAATTPSAAAITAARVSNTSTARCRLPTTSASAPMSSPQSAPSTASTVLPPKKQAAVPAARAKPGTSVQRA